MVKLGYNPIRCAWDSWIGHWKPWCVGKPDVFDVREVGAILRKATLEAHDHREVIADVSTPFWDAYIAEHGASKVKGGQSYLNAHVMDTDHQRALVTLLQWQAERDHPAQTIVEVGCFKGDTTAKLARCAPQAIVYAVDHFQGSDTDYTSDLVKLAGGPASCSRHSTRTPKTTTTSRSFSIPSAGSA